MAVCSARIRVSSGTATASRRAGGRISRAKQDGEGAPTVLVGKVLPR